MKTQALLLIAVTALFQTDCYSNPAESGTVRIKVRHSNEAIRQELLGYTPLGSDAAAVLEFVHTRLYSEGFGSTIGVMPKPGLSLTLGNYFGGVFSRVAVDADWQFDGERKLRNIEVQRSSAKSGPFPAVDPTVTPKIRIDLHRSDSAIREKLLKSTPLGSQRAEIGRFIELRLYSQSGAADGVALTAKPGIAVILGEYGDDGRSRKSIRAVWRFDKEDRLEDIYIKRVKVRE